MVKMSNKKIVVCFLAVLCLSLLLVGCAQNAPEEIPAAELPVDTTSNQGGAEVPQKTTNQPGVQQPADVVATEEAPPAELPPASGTTYEMVFTDKGVQPRNITINVGDTVVWKNNRTKLQGILRGTKDCFNVRSPNLNPGESFSWTFSAPIKCTLIDAIFTKLFMVVDVREPVQVVPQP